MSLGALLTVLPLASARAQNPDCEPPDILILLDVSGSMNAGGKYLAAKNAIDAVTQSTEDAVRYGLMLFPEPGAYPVHCSTSSMLAVDPALANWDSIYQIISPTLHGSTTANPNYFGGPRGDYDTPMYQALDAARTVPAFLDPNRRHYILLLTDGVQDCCHGGDYDDEIDCNPALPYTDPNYHLPEEYLENRADLVDLVTTMQGNGIDTFVVGFGGLVDAVTLDGLSQAGGTSIAGCTGAGDCYYQADNEQELTAALQAISQIVGVEVCDGLDNDCDTSVDEDTDQLCSTACGSGYLLCVDGALERCNAFEPGPEMCDRIDNDCDGDVDEACTCFNGTTQPCGNDTGACSLGRQTCTDGAWGACVGGTTPGIEACDGAVDEDCDGYTDEGCECLTGTTRTCGSDVGACTSGVQTCAYGRWGACTGVAAALTDTCANDVDDDCDGDTDEHCACTVGETRACGSSHGVCEPGWQECAGGDWGPCTDAVTGGDETCNQLDDDCDGETDEEATDCVAESECRCGTCAVPCDAGPCEAPATCIDGWCIADTCPDGTSCDGTRCAPDEGGHGAGEGDGSDGPGVEQDPKGIGQPEGCHCSSASATDAGLLVLFALVGLVRRRRR